MVKPLLPLVKPLWPLAAIGKAPCVRAWGCGLAPMCQPPPKHIGRVLELALHALVTGTRKPASGVGTRLAVSRWARGAGVVGRCKGVASVRRPNQGLLGILVLMIPMDLCGPSVNVPTSMRVRQALARGVSNAASIG